MGIVKVEEDGSLSYPHWVKKGIMLVNRSALDGDDPDHIYNVLVAEGFKPEEYGIRHPREVEFEKKTRSELIDEIIQLRSELLGYIKAGF